MIGFWQGHTIPGGFWTTLDPPGILSESASVADRNSWQDAGKAGVQRTATLCRSARCPRTLPFSPLPPPQAAYVGHLSIYPLFTDLYRFFGKYQVQSIQTRMRGGIMPNRLS